MIRSDLTQCRELFEEIRRSKGVSSESLCYHPASNTYHDDGINFLWSEWQESWEASRGTLVVADLDPNASWLSVAHMICADAGIASGHIGDRLAELRNMVEQANASGAWTARRQPEFTGEF